MTYEIIITDEFDNVKPKNFLKKKIDLPYNTLFKFLKEKRITLNGKKIKDDTILKKGDVVKVWLDTIKLRVEEEYVPQERKNLNIETIHEDENILVLNKPAGIIVQGSQDNETSLSLHLAYLKDKNKDTTDFNYFHVHRIDKNTSGLLICAKNRVTLRDLNEGFRERNVVKKYLCLCDGTFDKEEGEIIVDLQRNGQEAREKVSISRGNTANAEWIKNSHSTYKVLQEYEYNGIPLSLVEVEIKTGVMHQIRVHMKHLGNPIVGDTMYGKSTLNRELKDVISRQFLHATQISFTLHKKDFHFEAPLLEDLTTCLSQMNKVD
jgi:23S rRNA pseudouridine1911/1915/1917 synthase